VSDGHFHFNCEHCVSVSLRSLRRRQLLTTKAHEPNRSLNLNLINTAHCDVLDFRKRRISGDQETRRGHLVR
jgi:hypothetical protein